MNRRRGPVRAHRQAAGSYSRGQSNRRLIEHRSRGDCERRRSGQARRSCRRCRNRRHEQKRDSAKKMALNERSQISDGTGRRGCHRFLMRNDRDRTFVTNVIPAMGHTYCTKVAQYAMVNGLALAHASHLIGPIERARPVSVPKLFTEGCRDINALRRPVGILPAI